MTYTFKRRYTINCKCGAVIENVPERYINTAMCAECKRKRGIARAVAWKKNNRERARYNACKSAQNRRAYNRTLFGVQYRCDHNPGGEINQVYDKRKLLGLVRDCVFDSGTTFVNIKDPTDKLIVVMDKGRLEKL